MSNATVAIIGGGFSGTVAAIRLLSSPQRGGPTLPFGSKIVLVEPGRAGEGLAYRAGPDYWRLNVPAERMSAFPERPDDFLAFARGRNPLVSGGDFLPRSWYGDYLSDRLEAAQRRSPRWLSFERVRARATAIDVARSSARIWLSDGGRDRGRPRAARARQLAGRSAARGRRRRRGRRLEPALDGATADLRAARAAGRHRAHDDRHRARDRRAPPRRAHDGDLAAWPPAAAARGRDAPGRVEVRRDRPARPRAAVGAPAPLPRAGRGLRRRLARGAAAGAGGHARALARRAAAPAAALPASPARALGRASSPRAARDAAEDRDDAREEAARGPGRPHRRDAPHQGWRRRRLAAARQRQAPRGALRRRRQRDGTGRRPEPLVLRRS